MSREVLDQGPPADGLGPDPAGVMLASDPQETLFDNLVLPLDPPDVVPEPRSPAGRTNVEPASAADLVANPIDRQRITPAAQPPPAPRLRSPRRGPLAAGALAVATLSLGAYVGAVGAHNAAVARERAAQRVMLWLDESQLGANSSFTGGSGLQLSANLETNVGPRVIVEQIAFPFGTATILPMANVLPGTPQAAVLTLRPQCDADTTTASLSTSTTATVHDPGGSQSRTLPVELTMDPELLRATLLASCPELGADGLPPLPNVRINAMTLARDGSLDLTLTFPSIGNLRTAVFTVEVAGRGLRVSATPALPLALRQGGGIVHVHLRLTFPCSPGSQGTALPAVGPLHPTLSWPGGITTSVDGWDSDVAATALGFAVGHACASAARA